MRVKSTHAGSCQACGRIQKLPKGVLSKHGYAVRWNQFVGECPGSGHLPYEQSCKLIQTFITSAREDRKRIQARIDKLNTPATGEYIPATWQDRHSRYQDREVTLFWFERKYPGSEDLYIDVWYFNLEGKAERMGTKSIYADDVLTAATELNKCFATNELTPRVKQLDEYIRWQQKRVTDWKLSPLLDLKEVR